MGCVVFTAPSSDLGVRSAGLVGDGIGIGDDGACALNLRRYRPEILGRTSRAAARRRSG